MIKGLIMPDILATVEYKNLDSHEKFIYLRELIENILRLNESGLTATEKELPQRERTKHVHSLHQYVGKFVPQLVDYFLQRNLKNSKLICDPFMGSGTTLVESNVKGISSWRIT